MSLTQITHNGITDGTILNADINASAAIAGTKINPSFTSDITITNTQPKISLVDTNANDDFEIKVNAGNFAINDATNSANRFLIDSSGTVDINGNLDVGAGLDVTGEITATSHIDLPDDAKLKLGTGDDLQIYHDGSDSYITSVTGNFVIQHTNNSGDLIMKANDFYLRSNTNENYFRGQVNGAVELYHNNSKKLETTSSGASITGTCTATSFSGDGSNLSGVSSQVADGCITENSLTISNNYTMTTNKSGMSVGDITIASGVTVTIPSGSRYVIL